MLSSFRGVQQNDAKRLGRIFFNNSPLALICIFSKGRFLVQETAKTFVGSFPECGKWHLQK